MRSRHGLEAEQSHEGTARQWFNDKGEVFALLPLDGVHGRRLALVWSVDQLRAPALLAQSAEEFNAAVTEASHQAFGALRLASERGAWPLARAIADRWTGTLPASAQTAAQTSGQAPRTWALAGDAAHTVHPLAGPGPEPRPGRRGRAGRRHQGTRLLAQRGRSAPAAPLRTRAPAPRCCR